MTSCLRETVQRRHNYSRSNLFLFFFFFFRIQKELAEITIDPPPNCRLVVRSEISSTYIEEKSPFSDDQVRVIVSTRCCKCLSTEEKRLYK